MISSYATFSDNAVAAATIVIALAFFFHVAQWASVRKPAAALVTADGSENDADQSETDVSQKWELFGRIGLSLTLLGTLILLAGVVSRGLATERAPWGNLYEFGLFVTLILLVAYLALVRLWRLSWLAPAITGLAVVVLGLSMTVYVPAGPLVPALRSYWLIIHVAALAISAAIFAIGALVAVLYLMLDGKPESGIWKRIPPANVLDDFAFKLHAAGFVLWTFGALIAGPIWAQESWGRYWAWDAKEVWALVTWILYAGYLHARSTAGWRGRRAAIIAIVAFGSLVANYTLVNLIFPGLHSYAK